MLFETQVAKMELQVSSRVNPENQENLPNQLPQNQKHQSDDYF